MTTDLRSSAGRYRGRYHPDTAKQVRGFIVTNALRARPRLRAGRSDWPQRCIASGWTVTGVRPMKRAIGLMAVAGLCLLGCAHTPQQPGARSDLKNAAEKTLAEMEAKDPSLKDLVDKSAG